MILRSAKVQLGYHGNVLSPVSEGRLRPDYSEKSFQSQRPAPADLQLPCKSEHFQDLEYSEFKETFALFNAKNEDKELQPDPEYISNVQFDMTPSCRRTIVEWMFEVRLELDLRSETLHSAVTYFDRTLSKIPICRAQFQALAATCLWIASKIEEVNPPAVSDFAHVCAGAAATQSIICMERIVLDQLQFRMTGISIQMLVQALMRSPSCRNANSVASRIASFLVDLVIADYGSLCLDNLAIATAICLISHMPNQDLSKEECTCVSEMNPSLRPSHTHITFVLKCWSAELNRRSSILEAHLTDQLAGPFLLLLGR